MFTLMHSPVRMSFATSRQLFVRGRLVLAAQTRSQHTNPKIIHNSSNPPTTLPKQPTRIAHTAAAVDPIESLLPKKPQILDVPLGQETDAISPGTVEPPSEPDIMTERGKHALELLHSFARLYPSISGFILPWHSRIPGGIYSTLVNAGIKRSEQSEYVEEAVDRVARQIALRVVSSPEYESYDDITIPGQSKMTKVARERAWLKVVEAKEIKYEYKLREVERMLWPVCRIGLQAGCLDIGVDSF